MTQILGDNNEIKIVMTDIGFWIGIKIFTKTGTFAFMEKEISKDEDFSKISELFTNFLNETLKQRND